jgi:hypothetical protein
MAGLFDFLKDDKGFFQGGAEGRIGGRVRDFLESEPTNESVGSWRNDAMRDMARNFDINDNEEVLKLQQWINYQNKDNPNYTPLAEDGIFGSKTGAALKVVQGLPAESTPSPIVNQYDSSQVRNAIDAMGGDGSGFTKEVSPIAPPVYDRFGFGTEYSQGPITHEAANSFGNRVREASHYGPDDKSSTENIFDDLANALKGWR